MSYLGDFQAVIDNPAPPFSFFESFFDPLIENPDPNGGGSSDASTYQVSQFFPAGISASGTTAGGWNTVPAGTYHALSLAHFGFRVTTCIQYQLDAWLDPGDVPGEGYVRLIAPYAGASYRDLDDGEMHVTGRLGPGEYALVGRSAVSSSNESTQGATYSIIWTCSQCLPGLIGVQPNDVGVACGGTAAFAVTPNGAGGSLTYDGAGSRPPREQRTRGRGHDHRARHHERVRRGLRLLRRAGQRRHDPRAESPRAPPGGYGDRRRNRVRGPGPRVLDRSGGAEPGRRVAGVPVRRRPALRARVAIYNAAGARVRTLLDGDVSGSRALAWDGATSSGTRAPAGVYFLRVEAGSYRESRKLVLLR